MVKNYANYGTHHFICVCQMIRFMFMNLIFFTFWEIGIHVLRDNLVEIHVSQFTVCGCFTICSRFTFRSSTPFGTPHFLHYNDCCCGKNIRVGTTIET
jgi:hypothetical protein